MLDHNCNNALAKDFAFLAENIVRHGEVRADKVIRLDAINSASSWCMYILINLISTISVSLKFGHI